MYLYSIYQSLESYLPTLWSAILWYAQHEELRTTVIYLRIKRAQANELHFINKLRRKMMKNFPDKVRLIVFNCTRFR